MATNIIAELKAVLKLGVDMTEAKKVEETVQKVVDQMKRVTTALKTGTFSGAVEDVRALETRFKSAQATIREINTDFKNASGLLRAQGADQERLNSLTQSYLAILKQTSALRATKITGEDGNPLLSPSPQFSSGAGLDNAPKMVGFKEKVADAEATYKAFLTNMQAAQKASSDAIDSTTIEGASKRVQAEQAAAEKSAGAIAKTYEQQNAAAKNSFADLTDMINDFNGRTAALANVIGQVVLENDGKIAASKQRQAELIDELSTRLAEQVDLVNKLAAAKYSGQIAEARGYAVALSAQQGRVFGLEQQIRAEQKLQQQLATTNTELRNRTADIRATTIDTATANLAAKKYQSQVNSLSEQLRRAAEEQKKLIAQVNESNAALARAQQAMTRPGNNNQAQFFSSFSAALRNIQSVAVISLGPLSGLGSRVAAIGAIAGRSGVTIAALSAGVGALAAGIFYAVSSAVSFRRQFESQIALLDLTRTSTEGLGENFKFLITVADQYGIALEGIIRPVTKLKAAAIGTSIGPVFQDFVRDIGSIAGTFQLPTEEIGRFTKALEQMLSKGIVQAEELRGQLGDVLPGSAMVALEAFRTMTQQPLASMGDFLEAMKKGKIESEKFLSVFLKKYQELFGIDPTKPINTLNAAYARMNTALVQFVFAMDDAFGITKGVMSSIDALSSVLKYATSNMTGFVLVVRTFFTIATALIGLRIVAYFVAVTQAAATTAATFLAFGGASSGLMAAIGGIAGVVAGGVLVLYSLRTALGTAFGGGKDEADKASQAVKEFGASLDSVKAATNSGTIFKFVTSASDTSKFTQELANYIKFAKEKIGEKLVITPSINLDAALTQSIATLRNKSTGLNEELSRALGKSVKLTMDQLRTMAAQGGEIGKKASDAVEFTQQAQALSNLRDEYTKLTVSQQSMVQTVTQAQQSMTLLGAVFQFLGNNANIFLGVGTAVIVSLRAISAGFLGTQAAASVTSGSWAAAAVKLRNIAIAATVAGAALVAFGGSAKASDVTESIEPAIKRIGEYLQVVNETGKTDFGTLRSAQEILRSEIGRVSTELTKSRDDLDRWNKVYNATAKDAGSGNGLFGLFKKSSEAVSNIGITDKIKALEDALVKLKGLESEVGIISAQTEQKMGQAYSGLLGTDTESTNALSTLREKITQLQNDIASLNGTRNAAQQAAAKYAAEEREVAKSLAQTKGSIDEAKAATSEYMALYKQKLQLESSTKLNDILTETSGRAQAAKDGLLEQYNAQQRVNDEVEKATNLALESGLSQDVVNEKMATYRANLETIDAAQKSAAASTKAVKSEMKEQAQLVTAMTGPFNQFAQAIGGLASTGGLTFKNFLGSARDLVADLLKEIIALIIKVNILTPILQGIQGSQNAGTGIGGLLNMAIGAGGGFGGAGVPTLFASGGIVDGPTVFNHRGGMGIAGEAGAEAILPLKRGPGGQLGVASHGRGGTTINFNISTPDASSFRRSESQIAAMAQRAIGRGDRNL